jgi:hypothetical protein
VYPSPGGSAATLWTPVPRGPLTWGFTPLAALEVEQRRQDQGIPVTGQCLASLAPPLEVLGPPLSQGSTYQYTVRLGDPRLEALGP